MKQLFKIIVLVLCIIGTIASVSGNVSDFSVNPHKTVVGDVITIKGNASPNEIIQPNITLNTSIEVNDEKKYSFQINGIEVPTKKNTFTIQAKNVTNLNVKVKKYGLSWTLSKDATSGIATISQGNVPDWTFDIRIFGTAKSGVSSVPINIITKTTSSEIKANDNGTFTYEYSTSKLLPGTYVLTIGGISKEIKLLSKKEKEDKDKEDKDKSYNHDNNKEDDDKKSEVTSAASPEIKETIEISHEEGEITQTTKEPEETPSVPIIKENSDDGHSKGQTDSPNILNRIYNMFKFWS